MAAIDRLYPRSAADAGELLSAGAIYSSVGATSRATCTSAAISGVIGSRCGITSPTL